MDIFNRHSLTEALAARSPEVFFGVLDHFALKSLNRLHEETDRRDCRSINVTCKQKKKKRLMLTCGAEATWETCKHLSIHVGLWAFAK